MRLSAAITRYVELKRATGHRFCRGAYTLELFRRHHGDSDLRDIRYDLVRSFLHSKRPPDRFLHAVYYTMAGFVRFAIARGYLASSPLPTSIPTEPKTFVPFIYSDGQVRQILAAAADVDDPRCRVDVTTFRRVVLVLYGTGMRIGEALALTLGDVDLDHALVAIRDSKFYKSRLVPIGPELAEVISEQVRRRRRERATGSSPLFASRHSGKIRRATFETHYRRARRRAGVERESGAGCQPRVHDLRHTFAVRRLVSWYRDRANVQLMLPTLATYLGHINLSGTQRYLTLTTELLTEASGRFERYALGGSHE